MSNVPSNVIVKFKDPEFPQRLTSLLVSSGKVKVQGIGIFEIRKMKSRKFHDVWKKEVRTLEARNKIVFRPTKELQKSAQKFV